MEDIISSRGLLKHMMLVSCPWLLGQVLMEDPGCWLNVFCLTPAAGGVPSTMPVPRCPHSLTFCGSYNKVMLCLYMSGIDHAMQPASQGT